MLVPVEFPGPSHAGLDFIDHKQNIMLTAEITHGFQVSRSWHDHPALTLKRLHEDSARAVIYSLFNGFDIVIGDVPESRNDRFKTFLHRFLSCCRERAHGSAVE